jgi:asparagine synthase (glutamine-hydrolysing)
MCGIVGIVTDHASVETARALARMSAVIVHRGPDDSGAHISIDVGLAIRRLSIVDEAGGRQPMYTADGVSLIFNGEIYNYIALRNTLAAQGYEFETTSDTEVILNLYHAEGVEGLRKLNGMFAVAIHDSRSDELILIRDPIGIKPLYYFIDSHQFLFASEIKGILAALPAKPAVNPQAVWDFLSLRYVPPPMTIWQGIFKLEPGFMLRYSPKTHQTRIERFWQPNFTPDELDSGRDYAREFERQFLAAVGSHLTEPGVPLGLFLSGGLDSGAICAAAAELGQRNLHTFSIGQGGGPNDELTLARLVSDKFRTHHHEIILTRQLYFDELDKVAWHFDEPYSDDTGGAVLLLAREASRHVRVAMSGEGADELLLGYNPKRAVERLAAVERRYRLWPALLLRGASHMFGDHRARILRAIANEGPRAYERAAAPVDWALTDREKGAIWLGGAVRPTQDVVDCWYTLPTTAHPLVQSQQAHFQSWLVEDLLMKTDKMAMASSLEMRVPFLHLPMVEWCQRSPLQARIGDFEKGQVRSKAVLRDFAAKRLPKEILDAPKRGFPMPVAHWFSQMLREEGGLSLKSRAIRDWISCDTLDAMVARGAAGDRPMLDKLWSIGMLDRWFKVYVD